MTNGTNEANETNTTADSNDAAGGRPVIKFGTDGWRAVVGKDFNFEKNTKELLEYQQEIFITI